MTVKLKAPEGASSVCVEGAEYAIEKGFVEVEPQHYQTLLSHGYELAPEKPKAAKGDKTVKADKAAEEPAAHQEPAAE